MTIPSHRAIENLISVYAELVDDGDFTGVGKLFTHGSFTGSNGTVHGSAAVTDLLRQQIRLYADGTPQTRHLVTNLIVDVDDTTARARSSVTILQATDRLPLQPIACGRYRDEFAHLDGEWRFVSRSVSFQLAGHLNRHLLPI